MEAPPTYQELLTELNYEKNRTYKLEIQMKELKQQLELVKEELNKVNYAYTKAKKNEVLLTSVLQSKI